MYMLTSCPDRFGRKLMNRRETLLAKKENRKPRALTESDYILGVFDDARMGALRFSLDPKASVMSLDNTLWIAKFPSKNDEWNCGAWEMVVHDLAIMCKLNVPEAKLEQFSHNGSTFLVKRFDRNGTQRVHFSLNLFY